MSRILAVEAILAMVMKPERKFSAERDVPVTNSYIAKQSCFRPDGRDRDGLAAGLASITSRLDADTYSVASTTATGERTN